MASQLDRDLEQVDDLIRRLGREYQLYVSSQRRRRPDEERNQLDRLVRKLSNSSPRDNASRFRISNLQVKYNLYSEKWGKLVRNFEEGFVDPKERAKFLREAQIAAGSVQPEAEGPKAEAPARPNARSRRSVQIVVGKEVDEDVRRIYDLYSKAREANGEGALTVRFEKFKGLIRSQGSSLSQRSGRDSVEFDVKVKDGKVKLVAKPGGSQ